MDPRNKLETNIEKHVHFLVTDEVKNNIIDFTVMYVRKNCPEVDRASMTKVLDIVSTAIDDAYFKNIDAFNAKISKCLKECLDEVDPLANTGETRKTKK